jgi:radical SAM superfamily enzyme YgiQ (UPF0313 family)
MAHIQLIGVAEGKSPDGKIWKFPYALPIIIRALMETEHSFDLVDSHLHKKSDEELLEFIDNCDAKIYGISAFSHNYHFVKQICRQIKENHPDSIIIIGGILSGNYDVLIERADADIVATAAEGEKVLPEILDAIDSNGRLCDIEGIVFRDRVSGEIVKTRDRKVMSQAEYRAMPMPAYEYFNSELKELVRNIGTINNIPVKGFPLLTMRGCPFSCTFCGHLYGRRFLRKDWESFFDELELLMDRHGIEGFYSYDTNMFLNKREVDEYCSIYRERNHTFKISIELRPTFGDYAMFRKLREHGVRVVLFGIESGSQKILDSMKKGFKLNEMKRIFKATVDAGLMMHGNFLFGTPGENKHTIRETREFMLWMERLIYEQKREFDKKGKLCTSGYGWTVLIPSPTSELYDVAVDKGLIKDEEEYLISLGEKKSYKLVSGSLFKIALGHVGGDVNISEFPSKNALKSYVKYSNAVVKFRSLLFDTRKLYEIIVNYWSYLAFALLSKNRPVKKDDLSDEMNKVQICSRESRQNEEDNCSIGM